MPKQTLFDDDSEEDVSLKTENEYAKKYDRWREKEELHKLEQKYGSKPNADGSSDSEDESDEPIEISEETEAQFLKTLSLLKTKDPRIYDPSFKCFDEEEKKEQEKETKPKTLTFADSDEDDDDDGNIFSIEKKAEIVETNKVSTKTSQIKEGKIKEYLTGQAEHIDDEVAKDLAPLKALWSDPKLNEGEAFLRDYILNKKYLEDGDAGDAEDKIRDDEELEADEERVEEQGKFERAYNFRFEEPDQEYLKRFPRTMNYIRPKDDRRSRKRVEVRTRKEEEKQKKMEEIGRLKALKLKEIQEKIARIKEVTGNEDLAFKEADLESEFDPEEHDKRMKEIFDEEYYGDADEQKPVFPDLDEELEIENWDNYEPEHVEDVGEQGDEEPHCEDDDFNMDADYDPKNAREKLLEEVKQTLQGKKRRNRKKKSKLAQLLETEKPKFVPTVEEKSYNEYMEEYYKMDCEDVIGGDLPTRFKYREVVPNDYGLTIEEILLADDKELTQWVPLKRILKHRPDNVEKGDARNYAQKAADTRLKKKILPSLFKDLPEEPEIVVPIETTKKKKKKKKNKNKIAEETNTDPNEQNIEQKVVIVQNNESSELEEHNESVSETPKKKKHKKNITEESNTEETEQTNIEENGVKKKKKHKKNSTEESNTDELRQINSEENDINKQKNKKHKQNSTEESNTEEFEKTNTEESGINKQKKKKHKLEGFVVEDVLSAEPSQESAYTEGKDKKRKKDKQNLNDDMSNNDRTEGKTNPNDKIAGSDISKRNDNKNRKRKANSANIGQPAKKQKGNKKDFKNNFKQIGGFKSSKLNKGPVNPLVNLSDERLKAYGLNPKKYKNFLHFKKH